MLLGFGADVNAESTQVAIASVPAFVAFPFMNRNVEHTVNADVLIPDIPGGYACIQANVAANCEVHACEIA